MNKKKYSAAKRATAQILKEYNILSSKELYSMDSYTGCILYQNLKAGVLEQFDIDDEEMDRILDEILDPSSKA